MLAYMFLAQALTPLSSATLIVFQQSAIFLLIYSYISRSPGYNQGSCVEYILKHDGINVMPFTTLLSVQITEW